MDIVEEKRFFISFKFDSQGESPLVYIYDTIGKGTILEVFEEPILLNPNGWSWDESDWEPGPLASALLQMMNERADKLPEAGEPSGDF